MPVYQTHKELTAADTSGVTFRPNVINTKSGILQISNVCESGTNSTATATLHGRLSSDHAYAVVKILSSGQSGDTSTTVSAASVVSLFPDMKVTVAETAGNMKATVSILD
jgi:hypothetical protein|tara:strand:+ start:281 stop:610 length:330 start_codon:yes stop_codon:yes gene_type:complete